MVYIISNEWWSIGDYIWGGRKHEIENKKIKQESLKNEDNELCVIYEDASESEDEVYDSEDEDGHED